MSASPCWLWMWDKGSGAENEYTAYSRVVSDQLEAAYEADGVMAKTHINFGERAYTVRKTRKGWVQEASDDPSRWRAVKRVKRGDSPEQPTSFGLALAPIDRDPIPVFHSEFSVDKGHAKPCPVQPCVCFAKSCLHPY